MQSARVEIGLFGSFADAFAWDNTLTAPFSRMVACNSNQNGASVHGHGDGDGDGAHMDDYKEGCTTMVATQCMEFESD